mmetsp:Transcript_43579/g.115046  ORF Transcript_43579/g.115046 Transcript_43579/m.115046 type:complete len:204 (-) Transcript_43579:389-1000(-)
MNATVVWHSDNRSRSCCVCSHSSLAWAVCDSNSAPFCSTCCAALCRFEMSARKLTNAGKKERNATLVRSVHFDEVAENFSRPRRTRQTLAAVAAATLPGVPSRWSALVPDSSGQEGTSRGAAGATTRSTNSVSGMASSSLMRNRSPAGRNNTFCEKLRTGVCAGLCTSSDIRASLSQPSLETRPSTRMSTLANHANASPMSQG